MENSSYSENIISLEAMKSSWLDIYCWEDMFWFSLDFNPVKPPPVEPVAAPKFWEAGRLLGRVKPPGPLYCS